MTPSRVSLLIATLVQKMRAQDSWAGETHIQKAVYFLQTLLAVPTGFKFTLYKYGPFSFDLRDQLATMRGNGQLELQPQPPPYGPRLDTGPGASQLPKRFPKTLRTYDARLEYIAERLGGLGVGDLERLATALLVSEELPEGTVEQQAKRLNAYKPHVSVEAAREAVEDVDEMRLEVAKSGLATV